MEAQRGLEGQEVVLLAFFRTGIREKEGIRKAATGGPPPFAARWRMCRRKPSGRVASDAAERETDDEAMARA